MNNAIHNRRKEHPVPKIVNSALIDVPAPVNISSWCMTYNPICYRIFYGNALYPAS